MIVKHNHHGMTSWVVSAYKGENKDICICHQGCARFKPNTPENCPTAQAAFELSKKVGIVLVMECKDYITYNPRG